MKDGRNKMRYLHMALTVVLTVLAAAVAVTLIVGCNAWGLIVGYWIVLFIKDLTDGAAVKESYAPAPAAEENHSIVTAKRERKDTQMKSEFARHLKTLREKKGLSRRTLSELCGLHPDAVRRYEQGLAAPSVKAVCALAEYFGVSVDWMIGKDGGVSC